MKEIPLNHGYSALVDDEDYDELSRHKWHEYCSNGNYYARRPSPRSWNVKRKPIIMHRIIMGDISGVCYDHIDGNGLNNQKSNLRIATKQQNSWNRKKKKSSLSSKYKGVWMDIGCIRWRTGISMNGKRVYCAFLIAK